MLQKIFSVPKQQGLILFVLIFFIFLIQPSCTKLDVSAVSPSPEDVAVKFFAVPAGTQPAVCRIAGLLKKQNDEKEFVTLFAKEEGYPLWDKAQIKTGASANRSHRSAGESSAAPDTIIIIPFVLENTSLVNGYLEALINDTTSVFSHLRSDYSQYSFGSAADSIYTAEKFQMQIMQLDRAVFGYATFRVLDKKLFFDAVNMTADTSDMYWDVTISDYNIPGLPVPLPGDGCTASCTTIWTKGVGNNANIYIPHYPQCTYICLPPIATPTPGGIHPGGSTPHGGGSGGTVPIPPTLPSWNPNPCQLIDSLMKIPDFKDSILRRLIDSVNLNHEIGYDWTNPADEGISPKYWGGAGGIIEDVIWAGKRDGYAHNHNVSDSTLNIFSNEDLGKFYEFYRDRKMRKPAQFAFPLVTSESSYILVINDTVAFGSFARVWLKNALTVRQLGDYLSGPNSQYNVSADSNVTANAVHFIKALKNLNTGMCGLKLFMGTGLGSIQNYIPVSENNGILVQDPCL